jgi:GntR family transcriptional regulator
MVNPVNGCRTRGRMMVVVVTMRKRRNANAAASPPTRRDRDLAPRPPSESAGIERVPFIDGDTRPNRAQSIRSINEHGDPESVIAALREVGVRRASGLPLYIQIAEALEAALTRADLKLTSPIPTEWELAQVLGVSRPTIRQALASLEQRSVLYKRRGVGTFRAPHAFARPQLLRSLYDELVEQGSAPVTRVLQIVELPAPAQIAADLHLPSGAPLVFLQRLRMVDGQPIVLHTTYLNLDGKPPPDRVDLEQGSLYTILRTQYGVELTLASQDVSARAATPDERKYLELGSRGCVVVAQRTSFDAAGRGIEWAINVYPGGTQSFRMRLSAW